MSQLRRQFEDPRREGARAAMAGRQRGLALRTSGAVSTGREFKTGSAMGTASKLVDVRITTRDYLRQQAGQRARFEEVSGLRASGYGKGGPGRTLAAAQKLRSMGGAGGEQPRGPDGRWV